MKAIQVVDAFIKKYMPLIVLLVLACGYWAGLGLSKPQVQFIKSSILPSVILMIYAMLITMRMDDLKDALVYPRGMIFGSILSLAVAPLLMIPIASVFTKNPQLYTGLLFASIVPRAA